MLNMTMRHTKHTVASCLRPDKEKPGQMRCRFNYPKPLQDVTTCEYENEHTVTPTEGKRKKAVAETKRRLTVTTMRNDPLLGSHMPMIVAAWRANTDAQYVNCLETLMRYALKYMNKGEPASDYFKRIARHGW
jgi:hypothetical protein